MQEIKPLNCCGKFMELKDGYCSGWLYLIFQCKKCGKVKVKSTNDKEN